MSLSYYTGFPTNEDSLGGTQLKFFTNWETVKTFVDTNHYDFANTLAGNHKWVWYGRQTANFPDTSTPSNLAIATYAAADTATPVRTQLWFQPQNDATGADAIQLTAGNVTDAAFSTNTLYNTSNNVENTGGWTFLPGNLLLQYGRAHPTTSAAIFIITFPIAFSAIPYSILGEINKDGAVVTYRSSINATSTTGFTFNVDSTIPIGGNSAIFWTAIGPA